MMKMVMLDKLYMKIQIEKSILVPPKLLYQVNHHVNQYLDSVLINTNQYNTMSNI